MPTKIICGLDFYINGRKFVRIYVRLYYNIRHNMKSKKYPIILFTGLLLIPIILNFVLQMPSLFPIIGDSQTWLSFWASYIGAVASFTMIAVTLLTLKQNKAQLNEIKRQWEEEHRPHLVCRIIVNKKAFILQISNPSQFDASDVIIRFGDDLINNLDDKFRDMYTNTSQNPVYISSGKSWNCFIGWCEDINQKWKDKDFNIVTEVSYNDKYRLNAIIPIKTFVNRINILIQSPLEDAAQDLVAGLVKPHSVSPYKTVQVSLDEISKTLSKISTKLDTADETD